MYVYKGNEDQCLSTVYSKSKKKKRKNDKTRFFCNKCFLFDQSSLNLVTFCRKHILSSKLTNDASIFTVALIIVYGFTQKGPSLVPHGQKGDSLSDSNTEYFWLVNVVTSPGCLIIFYNILLANGSVFIYIHTRTE